jgi:hypothetical protein
LVLSTYFFLCLPFLHLLPSLFSLPLIQIRLFLTVVLCSVAWMELYLCLANFFSHLDMSLYDTDEQSVQWDDCGNAMIRRHVKVSIDRVR